MAVERDAIPETPLLDRERGLGGDRIDKMAMSPGDPANREAFLAEAPHKAPPMVEDANG